MQPVPDDDAPGVEARPEITTVRLSLSKPVLLGREAVKGFDKLSPNGGGTAEAACAGASPPKGRSRSPTIWPRPTRIIMRRAIRFGAAGDFTTAPEISQMFGELVGLWLADLWLRSGRPEGAHYVELGPGRGTLAADALRAMQGRGARARTCIWSRPARCSARRRRRGCRARPGMTISRPCPATDRCWSSPTNSSTRCRSSSSMQQGRDPDCGTGETAASSRTARSKRETSPASLAIAADLVAPDCRAGRRGADRGLWL